MGSLDFMSIRSSKVKLSAWLACCAGRQNNQLRVAVRGRWNRGWLDVASVAAAGVKEGAEGGKRTPVGDVARRGLPLRGHENTGSYIHHCSSAED